MRNDSGSDAGLKTNYLALILGGLYGLLPRGHRRILGALLRNVIQRLEGGPMYSFTLRRILANHHDVEIGAYSYGACFNPGFFPPKIRIGRYCSIANNVRVVNENHPIDELTTHPIAFRPGEHRRQLTIGHDVWIGFSATILPGCTEIGTGAIIGAGAVVTKNVPSYAIVAGNPAKVLRYRFGPEEIEKLLASRWWELNADTVRDSSSTLLANAMQSRDPTRETA